MTEGVPEDLYTSIYARVRKRLRQAVEQGAGERDDFSLEQSDLYRLAHTTASAAMAAINDEVHELEGGG
jgi:hypothetical protein